MLAECFCGSRAAADSQPFLVLARSWKQFPYPPSRQAPRYAIEWRYMETVQRATMKIGGRLFGRLVFAFLVVCSIALGAAGGLLFVYTSDLPEIHALEDYHPQRRHRTLRRRRPIHRHLRFAAPDSAHLRARFPQC